MTTCQHCKHWFTTDPSQIKIYDRGICLRANSNENSDGIRTVRDEESEAHALSTVVSSFGYRMVINQLETTADFGCNQFEEGGQ